MHGIITLAYFFGFVTHPLPFPSDVERQNGEQWHDVNALSPSQAPSLLPVAPYCPGL